MTGPVENQAVFRAYAAALPTAVITACRLHAGPAELRRRIMTRGEGGSWPQPGDPLRGQPESYLAQAAEQAAADARTLDHASFDALRIDTTGRTATEAADLTAVAARWPGLDLLAAGPPALTDIAELSGRYGRVTGPWHPASVRPGKGGTVMPGPAVPPHRNPTAPSAAEPRTRARAHHTPRLEALLDPDIPAVK